MTNKAYPPGASPLERLPPELIMIIWGYSQNPSLLHISTHLHIWVDLVGDGAKKRIVIHGCTNPGSTPANVVQNASHSNFRQLLGEKWLTAAILYDLMRTWVFQTCEDKLVKFLTEQQVSARYIESAKRKLSEYLERTKKDEQLDRKKDRYPPSSTWFPRFSQAEMFSHFIRFEVCFEGRKRARPSGYDGIKIWRQKGLSFQRSAWRDSKQSFPSEFHTFIPEFLTWDALPPRLRHCLWTARESGIISFITSSSVVVDRNMRSEFNKFKARKSFRPLNMWAVDHLFSKTTGSCWAGVFLFGLESSSTMKNLEIVQSESLAELYGLEQETDARADPKTASKVGQLEGTQPGVISKASSAEDAHICTASVNLSVLGDSKVDAYSPVTAGTAAADHIKDDIQPHRACFAHILS